MSVEYSHNKLSTHKFYTKIFCRKFSNCSSPTVFISNTPMPSL